MMKCKIPRSYFLTFRVRLDPNMKIYTTKTARSDLRQTSYSTRLRVERTDRSYQGKLGHHTFRLALSMSANVTWSLDSHLTRKYAGHDASETGGDGLVNRHMNLHTVTYLMLLCTE